MIPKSEISWHSSGDEWTDKMWYIYKMECSIIKKEWDTLLHQFSHSVVSDSVTPWTAARQDSLSITNSWSLPKFMSIESVMTSNHLVLCRLLLACPQSFPASESFQMSQLLASGGQSIGSFTFNITPSNEHPGLISFRTDWLDLLAVQGTLKSLLQHRSSKVSNYLSLSLLYRPTVTSIHDHWKNHSLD